MVGETSLLVGQTLGLPRPTLFLGAPTFVGETLLLGPPLFFLAQSLVLRRPPFILQAAQLRLRVRSSMCCFSLATLYRTRMLFAPSTSRRRARTTPSRACGPKAVSARTSFTATDIASTFLPGRTGTSR